jgi:CxxC motif-containing protein (DUF1111 family)
MRTLSRSLLHTLPFLTLTLIVVLVGISNMHAQAATASGGCTALGACDIGPRSPGTVAAGPIPVCPLGGPVKFNFSSSVPCVDISQPQSPGSPQPPAGGAGNVVGVASTLTGVWFDAVNVFEEVASVSGTAVGTGGVVEGIAGLGPAFNSNSCFSCHEAPAVGGTSGGSVTINITPSTQFTFNMPLNPAFTTNPELTAMMDQGATNINPTFPTQFNTLAPNVNTLNPDGPSLEVRLVSSGPGGGSGGFVVQPGSVAELFTIQGRSDAPNCVLAQFPFSSLGARSISFRIPTPTFGLGFVEATSDGTLVSNLAINNNTVVAGSGGLTVAQVAASLDIAGSFNRSGNDGTITRFGWKAQNKSLLIFAGEASTVEMGVTNNLFPNEKTVAGNGPAATPCPTSTALQPEDELLDITPPSLNTSSSLDAIASIISTNAENNRVFMLMNAAPAQCDAPTAGPRPYGTPGTATCPAFTTPVLTGQAIFNNNNPSSATFTGCALCHTPTQTSGPSQQADLSNQTYHPFSDFALHTMGTATTGLADGVNQGLALSGQFRTAPLWGLGQRVFFLHDGRASDLATAIQDHCPGATATSGPSTTNESCGAVSNFLHLTKPQQQDLLDYLRSL